MRDALEEEGVERMISAPAVLKQVVGGTVKTIARQRGGRDILGQKDAVRLGRVGRRVEAMFEVECV